MAEQDIYRSMNRDEFDLAVQWATGEGWNPGLDDADVFWETDPEGYVCIERGGEIVGAGSIVSYGDFGFMGFFIVRSDLRGQGIGRGFWHWRKERLLGRLSEKGSIGMDGVFDMQPFYAKGGFAFTHRNLRMEGLGKASEVNGDAVELSKIPFELVSNYDHQCFGYEREAFLKSWINPPRGAAFGCYDGERLKGFGVIRQCGRGFKIGPLFANDDITAETLFVALQNQAVGKPVFLDIPEINPGAVALAERYSMKEVFGCARMYYGPIPQLPWERIYGITTFELG